MLSLARYRTAFASAPLRRTFLISIIGRLPIGVTGLAILVLVQSAPGLGRMIDRHGPRAVLRFCALAFPSALALLIYGSEAAVPWLEIAATAAAGASFPPITVCMRTYMRRALTDEALLSAAFSAESVLIEVIFIVGPLVVAVFAATAAPHWPSGSPPAVRLSARSCSCARRPYRVGASSVAQPRACSVRSRGATLRISL